MEQFAILLIFGAVALIKWLMEKSAEVKEKQRTAQRLEQLDRELPASPVFAPRPDAFPTPDYDDAARRLREALGMPEEFDLPPIRRPASAVPQTVPGFRREEVKVVPVADLEQRTVALPPPLAKRRMPLRRPPIEKTVMATPSVRAGLEELLGSHDGLRKAILAQEILGTPKGLVF